MPRSGIGSTLQSSKNFREGLENVVEYLKAELKKDKISILGELTVERIGKTYINLSQTPHVGT